MNKPALPRIPLIALLLLLPGGETSLACSYGPPYRTVCETFAEADAVIVGRIERVGGGDLSQTVFIIASCDWM